MKLAVISLLALLAVVNGNPTYGGFSGYRTTHPEAPTFVNGRPAEHKRRIPLPTSSHQKQSYGQSVRAPQPPRQEMPQSYGQSTPVKTPQPPRQEMPQSYGQSAPVRTPEPPRQERPQPPRQEMPQSYGQSAPVRAPQPPRQEMPQSYGQSTPVKTPQPPKQEMPQSYGQSAPVRAPQPPRQERPQSYSQFVRAPEPPKQERPQSYGQSTPFTAPQPPKQEMPQSYGRDMLIPKDLMIDGCPVSQVQPLIQDNVVTETYCRCKTGSYGRTCEENIPNPCTPIPQTMERMENEHDIYHNAAPVFTPDYFIQCGWGIPFLFKCPAPLVWDQENVTCNWPKEITPVASEYQAY